MAKVRTTKPSEFNGARITGALGTVEFDAEGVSKKEYDREAVQGICTICPDLRIVLNDEETAADEAAAAAEETADTGASSRGAARAAASDDAGSEDAPEELSEEDQATLDAIKESSVEGILQALEGKEVPAEEYASIDYKTPEGRAQLDKVAFKYLRSKED